MTTASAPFGSIPPVGIGAHSPLVRPKFGISPIFTSATMVKGVGRSSLAPKASLAARAYPSTEDLSNPGRSSPDMISIARILLRASLMGTHSDPRGLMSPRDSKISCALFTLKNGRMRGYMSQMT